MRGRPVSSRVVVFVAAFLSLAALPIVAVLAGMGASSENPGAQTEGGISGPVERYDGASGRLSAALQSFEAEKARIEQARLSFAADAASTPDTVRDYLVSFGQPVLAGTVLEASANLPAWNLRAVFTWLQAEATSEHFSYGEHAAADIQWVRGSTGASRAAEVLARFYDGFLAQKESTLRSTSTQQEESQTRSSIDRQADETARIRSDAMANGVPLYGVHCTCSPRALNDLAAALGIEFRAVERAAANLLPIPPNDPVRDLVISSGGRYGR